MVCILAKTYRLDSTFRGFLDFALIGAVVLAFLHPPDLRGFIPTAANLLKQSPSNSPKQNSGPLAQFNNRMAELEKEESSRKLSPTRTQGVFERELFESSSPVLRKKLIAAAEAFESYRPQQTLTILEGADGNDHNVMLLRGMASFALPGGMNRQIGLQLLRQAADKGQGQANTLFGKSNLAKMAGIRQDPELGIQYLKRAAEAGDAYAAHYLSRSYMNGLTGSIDAATAIRYLRIAGENGRASAVFELAMAHRKGFGVPKDEERFLRLMEKAATLGHGKAEIVIGLVHFSQYMEGLTPGIQISVDWLSKAARKDNPEALLWLGRIFTLFKDTTFYDPPRGAKFIKRCTELGHADCFTEYATLLRKGNGVPVDPVLSYAYFDQAIKLGNRRAWNLSKATKLVLTPKEIDRAQQLSATLKPKQQKPNHNLIALLPSKLVPTFRKKKMTAVEGYRQACDRGEMLSCTKLGLTYESGKNVAQDKKKARKLFRKACDGGHTRAVQRS
jgi:TPR repeat protein